MSWSLLWIIGFFVIYLWLGAKLLARLILCAILGGITAALFVGEIATLAGVVVGLSIGIVLYRFSNNRPETSESVLF